MKRIGHEVLASSDCFETRVLLDCKIVTQVLSAEINIVDAWFGQVTSMEHSLECFELETKHSVVVPPFEVGTAVRTQTLRFFAVVVGAAKAAFAKWRIVEGVDDRVDGGFVLNGWHLYRENPNIE